MKKIWSITVGCQDCPSRFISDGYSFCTYEDGPKYCNMEDCPIKKHLNMAVEHGEACDCATPDCIRSNGKPCSVDCEDYTPAS